MSKLYIYKKIEIIYTLNGNPILQMSCTKRSKSGAHRHGRLDTCYKGNESNQCVVLIFRRKGIEAFVGVDSDGSHIFYECDHDMNI